jgi:alcohol dehydrogenase class IV
MWEKAMPINEVREIRGKVNVFLGAGAIEKIYDIAKELKENNRDKVLIVTGRASYKTSGAWDHVEKALKDNGMEYVLYNKVSPNPNAYEVDEATQMAMNLGAKAVIAIGGGSPIDTSKSVAIMVNYPEYNAADLYEYRFTPTKSLPVIAINTTHGTGSEGNRFAVISILEKQYKPAIAYDISYPMYSIDDPKLMTGLSPSQTRYTSVDAVNHVIEACTTVVAGPYPTLLAKETVRLVEHYLPKALENPEDLEARYYLAYAALIAGISFDNGMLHLTHALEHPLSTVNPNLPHGLGLTVILPSIIRYIYPARPEVLGDVLSPIVPGLKGTKDEAETAAQGVKKWMHSVGITDTLTTLGFKEEQVARLVELTFTTPSLNLLLGCSPVPATKELVEKIYKESF